MKQYENIEAKRCQQLYLLLFNSANIQQNKAIKDGVLLGEHPKLPVLSPLRKKPHRQGHFEQELF